MNESMPPSPPHVLVLPEQTNGMVSWSIEQGEGAPERYELGIPSLLWALLGVPRTRDEGSLVVQI